MEGPTDRSSALRMEAVSITRSESVDGLVADHLDKRQDPYSSDSDGDYNANQGGAGLQGYFTDMLLDSDRLARYNEAITAAIAARPLRELGQLWVLALLVLLIALNDPPYIARVYMGGNHALYVASVFAQARAAGSDVRHAALPLYPLCACCMCVRAACVLPVRAAHYSGASRACESRSCSRVPCSFSGSCTPMA